MDFLTVQDFKAVCDDQTLEVIHQSDTDNLARAEHYAIEEVSGYLRSRYNIEEAFSKTDDDRNNVLVMITCDIALYHLIAWLPKRIGFEIRKERYNYAITWLKNVQKGIISPDLPLLTNSDGEDVGNPIRYGGMEKSVYDY